jgi:hypothetical protein
MLVNAKSASYTGQSHKSWCSLQLEGDHRTIIKFPSPSSPGYETLVARIIDAVETKVHEEVNALSTLPPQLQYGMCSTPDVDTFSPPVKLIYAPHFR